MKKMFHRTIRRALRIGEEHPQALLSLKISNENAVRKVINGRIIDHEAWMQRRWRRWHLELMRRKRKEVTE